MFVDTTNEMECEVGGTGEGPVTASVDFGDGTSPVNVQLQGKIVENVIYYVLDIYTI